MEAPPPPPPDALLLRQAAAMLAAAQKTQQPGGQERCPRCASRDTKFCYYNNYNTAQPRHFCRACRRYWTLGGSLRNVPVGGSARRNKRPARRPTRAIAAAAVAAATTATTIGPFAAASHVPESALQGGGGLLASLLLGSASSPLLALGAAPVVLEGRLGSDDHLGLGQPALLGAGAGDLAQLGFGAAGPLPWPAAATILEGERAEAAWNWKSCGAFLPLPPAAAPWQELAAAAPPAEAGVLHLHHGGSPHLLL